MIPGGMYFRPCLYTMRKLRPKDFGQQCVLVYLLLWSIPALYGIDSLRLRSLYLVGENDHFRLVDKTDQFYTSGFEAGIEWSTQSPWLSGAYRPFFRQSSPTSYRVFVRHQIYSPTNIQFPEQYPVDYPYSALLTAGLSAKNDHREWQYLIGLRGPLAQGESLQRFMHKLNGYREPVGWNNQMGDQFLLQVTGQIEHPLRTGKGWYTSFNQEWRIGNIRTSGAGGIELGTFRDRWRCSLTFLAEALLYNGQFPDGWTTHQGNLHSFVFHSRIDVQIPFGRFDLEFGQWFISSELRGREAHGWGRIGLRYHLLR